MIVEMAENRYSLDWCYFGNEPSLDCKLTKTTTLYYVVFSEMRYRSNIVKRIHDRNTTMTQQKLIASCIVQIKLLF